MKYTLYFLLITLALSCNHIEKKEIVNESSNLQKSAYDSLEANSIMKFYLDNMDSLRSLYKLSGIELLGFLPKKGEEFLLLYGERSSETYREQNLYIFPMCKLASMDSIKSRKFSLPGKLYDMFDSLTYQTRIFYGECVKDYTYSIIWYQKERIKPNNWSQSYFILDLKNNAYKYYRLKSDELKLDEILDNVRKGRCKELSGIDTYTEP